MHSVSYSLTFICLNVYKFEPVSIDLDVPGSVDYFNCGNCATLYAFADAGNQVLTYRVKSNPECIDVWGTTLNPLWSPVDC